MKQIKFLLIALVAANTAITAEAQAVKNNVATDSAKTKKLYIDVHHLGAGKVTAKAVAEAHAKDLAVEKKYGLSFIKYWVDEEKGDVYCLSSSPSEAAIKMAHAEAHGLLPDQTLLVTDGVEDTLKNGKDLYLDIHNLGAGKVTAAAVAKAHKKDLAVQEKYNVNFINYWVNEKDGVVLCLSQAPGKEAIISTHKEAHGLIPISVEKVIQGQ